MLCNKLQENTNQQGSNRAVDHLKEQKPEWVRCLDPHVPESGIDPDRGEHESQKQRPTILLDISARYPAFAFPLS